MAKQQPFHHYVPQFQLRHLTDEEGKVWVFDRKENRIFRAGPRSVGGVKEFYTYKDKKGKEHTEIEELNSQIESVAAPIINELHHRRKTSLTPQEKADLSVLLALNWMRTPAAKERTEVMLEAGATMHMRLNAQNKKVFYNQVEKLEQKLGKKYGDKEKLRQSILKNRYRVRFDKIAYLRFLMSSLLDIAESIQRMQWKVVSLNKKRSFVLSDINFTVEQVEPAPFPYGDRGLWSPGSQSMCVLTNKVAILMRPVTGGVGHIRPGLDFVRSSNVINATRSQRFIFSNSEALLKSVAKTAKLHTISPEKIGVEVYSGPEGKTLRFDAEHGLINKK